MAYQDNLGEVLASYADELPQESHTLTLSNNVEYARYLHDKRGYYVFNPEHAVQMVRQWLADVIRSGKSLSDRNVALALEAAGFDEVDFLRSYTDETQPPVKAGQGRRKAHPGGWADITGILKSAYQVSVDGQVKG